MVAFTGVLFLILSLSKLREKVAKDVPEVLKIGIQAAVGTLIVFIALRGAGFIVQILRPISPWAPCAARRCC